MLPARRKVLAKRGGDDGAVDGSAGGDGAGISDGGDGGDAGSGRRADDIWEGDGVGSGAAAGSGDESQHSGDADSPGSGAAFNPDAWKALGQYVCGGSSWREGSRKRCLVRVVALVGC
jgi:hypothetical protein